MLFFPFHVGDWITGTRLMTAQEKGVYLDLLVFYYSVERPITEDECKRIARAYPNAEQLDMQYILKTHFIFEDGCYRHKRCDMVIAEAREISQKRKKASDARWRKYRQSKNNAQGIPNAHPNDDSNAHASASTSGDANGMLTISHKPNISTNVDKKKNKKEKAKPIVEKPADVSDTVWADYTLLRNNQKAPLTTTALNAIRKEATEAGITLEEALSTCCMRGWRGFKACWLRKGNQTNRQASSGPRDLEPDWSQIDYGESGLM